MADRYWSASTGQDKVNVAETAGSTAGAHVEVRITYDTAALANNKAGALAALQMIAQRIAEDTWPPV
jgi:prephenate dehydratase